MKIMVTLVIAFTLIGLTGAASAYYPPFEYPSYSGSSLSDWSYGNSFDRGYVSFGYTTILDDVVDTETVTIPIPASSQNEINWFSELENGFMFYGHFSSMLNIRP